jgi:hypothetical protein
MFDILVAAGTSAAKSPPLRGGKIFRFNPLFALDKSMQRPVFIHKGHESVMLIARKPRNHAGVLRNNLNPFTKRRRAFFDRKTKKAFRRSTYRAFLQAVHNVIHRDCGQFSGTGLCLRLAVKTPHAGIPAAAPARHCRLAAGHLSV